MPLVPQLKVALITFGIALVPYGLVWLLTSLILTQTIDDVWIKPGEQFAVCHDLKFTVNPGKEGVFGFKAYGRSNNRRITHEIYNGTFKDTKMNKVSRFRAQGSDIISVNATTSAYSFVEVVYYTVTVDPGKSIMEYIIEPKGGSDDGKGSSDKKKNKNREDDENPINTHRVPKFLFKRSSPKERVVRHVAFSMSGTGNFSGSSIFPSYREYQVEINGTTGTPYQINITLTRGFYNVSKNVTSFPKGGKILVNSGEDQRFCMAVEMAYNGPITDALNSETKLGLDSKVRYTIGDFLIIGFFSSFFVLVLIFLFKSILAQLGIVSKENFMMNGLFEMNAVLLLPKLFTKEDKEAMCSIKDIFKRIIA